MYCDICFINRSINFVQYSNLGLIVATTWYDSLLQLLKKNVGLIKVDTVKFTVLIRLSMYSVELVRATITVFYIARCSSINSGLFKDTFWGFDTDNEYTL